MRVLISILIIALIIFLIYRCGYSNAKSDYIPKESDMVVIDLKSHCDACNIFFHRVGDSNYDRKRINMWDYKKLNEGDTVDLNKLKIW